MMYDILVIENLSFGPSTRKRKSGVFKKSHSGDRFQKPTSLVLKTFVYEWTES